MAHYYGTITTPQVSPKQPSNATVCESLAALLVPPSPADTTRWRYTSHAQRLLTQAYEKGSETRGISKAREWATDKATGATFRFSQRTLEKDSSLLFALNNNLDTLIQRSQDRLRDRIRLSHASIDALMSPDLLSHLQDHDDVARIHGLVDGISIPTSQYFQPQPTPEPLRPKYKLAMPAVHKLLQDQARDGTILILPTATLLASQHANPLHYQSLGWTTKSGQDSGRVTGDMSFTEWTTSLNGIDANAKSDVRSQITSRWGTINLPTLFHIVDDILLQADAHGWDAISLYKKDIKAAFHRLLFHPDSVCLTAFALDELYSILHLVGNFGWTGTPFAWDVVGRIMKAAAMCTIQGTLRLYVDDFFGACLTTMLRANNEAVDTVIVTLLGPEALAPKKDKSGRSLVILGWDFDLDARTVSISESNLLSTLYAFMEIGDGKKVSLLELERAASQATRYSVLARPMLAFTSALYKDIAGFKGDRSTRHSLSANSIVDVYLWKAYLTLVGTHPKTYGRQLDSFRPLPLPSVDLGFDGSLQGLGVGIKSILSDNILAHTGIFPVPCRPTTDSSYQNTFELMSVVVGLLLCYALGLRNFSYRASGDSAVTLSWLKNDKVSSMLGRRASIAFTIISATIGAHNTDTNFVPGKENTLYDALSRGWSTPETRALNPTTNIRCETDSPILAILTLIDPQLPDLTTLQTLSFIESIHQMLSMVPTAHHLQPSTSSGMQLEKP